MLRHTLVEEREISCVSGLPGVGLAISRHAELGQERRSTSINQSVSSPASQNFRIMTWSLQRDDNALAAIEGEDARIDCEHCARPARPQTLSKSRAQAAIGRVQPPWSVASTARSAKTAR